MGGDPASDVQRVGLQVLDRQLLEQPTTVGERRGRHPLVALRSQRPQLLDQPPALVEQLVGPVLLQPLLEDLQVRRVALDPRQRDLVTEVGVLDLDAVDLVRPGPTLGGAQHDGRPTVPDLLAGLTAAGRLAQRHDLLVAAGERRVEVAEHLLRVAPRDDDRVPALAAQVGDRVLVGGPAEHGRTGDLVAVEVEDRQDGAVAARVEEVRELPRAGERPGLRLAVPDDTGDEEVRVVHGRPAGVRQRIPELAALVDAAGGLDADVAGDPAGRGELPEQGSTPSASSVTCG